MSGERARDMHRDDLNRDTDLVETQRGHQLQILIMIQLLYRTVAKLVHFKYSQYRFWDLNQLYRTCAFGIYGYSVPHPEGLIGTL